ncbi:Protein CBG03509 [Caenorhabditis briggsae]|uniref:Protein CBG03509 n=1 Tax=Caenorhabditis briggsae TaxID=6238 RepID=A8WV89_CAEBR|nr:Protein CBG03509 [Caenorhabditis briggsae]CAP24400.2 Protein CBG03509 [Caenorhabditis briggsae]
MPRSLLNHFDPKRRRTNEGDDTNNGSRLDANVNQEWGFETVEDDEIWEEDVVDSSIEEEQLEDESEWFSRDVDTENNLDGKEGFSEFSKLLRKAGSRELQVLFSACINRLSERGFDMFLTTYDNEDFVKNVRKIWNFRKNETSVYFFCNQCGKDCERGQKICCGTESIAKFVRVGIVSQLEELVSHYFEDILDIRKKLIDGSVPEHNLASQYLEHLWTSESHGALNLSGMLSIDGVNVPGQKKKIWPISLTLLDLPTSLMQLSSNILMEGILECSENPSTTLWNTIYPIINSDCNGVTGTVMNRPYTFHCVTVSADQPVNMGDVRRIHKVSVTARYEMSTEDVKRDSELGLNGFGDVPSKFLNFCLPYETPIDILHNVGEGNFSIKMGAPKENRSCLPPSMSTSYIHVYPVWFSHPSLGKFHSVGMEQTKLIILLHNAVRRELMVRVDQDDSESFRDFLSLVPNIKKKKAYGRNVINSLKPEDSIVNGCSLLYSQLFLPLGTLKSEYWDTNSTGDIFFVKTNGQSLCYRFIAAPLIDGDLDILAEYIIETDNSFSSLKRKVETLTGKSYQHGRNILEMLCRYEGVKVGKLSGKRHILKTSTITSIGCYKIWEKMVVSEKRISVARVVPVGCSGRGGRGGRGGRAVRGRKGPALSSTEPKILQFPLNNTSLPQTSVVPVSPSNEIPPYPISYTLTPSRQRNVSEFDDDFQQDFQSTDFPSTSQIHLTPSQTFEEKKTPSMLIEPSYISRLKLSCVGNVCVLHHHAQELSKLQTAAESTSVSEYDYENVKSEASSRNRWNPVSFGRSNYFDSINGVPLANSIIEVNNNKLIKNDREADTSEFLQIAARAHGTNSEVENLALGVACLTEMLNKTLRRLKITESDDLRSNEPFVNPQCGFDLEEATNIGDVVVLPSGRTLKMSSCISVLTASSWTSSNYKTDAKSLVRHIFTKVADKDPFFPAYSASSESNRGYTPLGNAFFEVVTNFVIAGFRQSSSLPLQTYTTRLVREVIDNLLDRQRSQLAKKTSTNPSKLAEELKAQLEACNYAPQM